MKKPWGGRFSKKTHPLVERFTESVSFDRELARQDVRGSVAHAEMLCECGIITSSECRRITSALKGILRDIEAGSFQFHVALEDVHMNIEAELVRRIGQLGRKLHTARSRNDQVSVDMRLWVCEQIDAVQGLARSLQAELVCRADEHRKTLCPGFTHMQFAQPTLLAQYLLAYVEMLERDCARLSDCRKRTAVSTLGACALAGTSLPIDPGVVARKLGLAKAFANSVDAVSDRDFAIEFVSDLALLAAHLSRLAEDWIIWSSPAVGYLGLDEAFCTGSSIMPQKKNPDVLELVRGKAGRVYGNLVTLLTMLKGLPLAYNRDMQEDKPPLFDSALGVRACLAVLAPLVKTARFDVERMARDCEAGFADATAVAEYLVRKGLPFREAHEVVGRIVADCIGKGRERIGDATLEDLVRFSKSIDADVFDVLGGSACVRSYRSAGSSGYASVRRQVTRWKRRLSRMGQLGD